jgi:hypothetical protein
MAIETVPILPLDLPNSTFPTRRDGRVTQQRN